MWIISIVIAALIGITFLTSMLVSGNLVVGATMIAIGNGAIIAVTSPEVDTNRVVGYYIDVICTVLVTFNISMVLYLIGVLQ